MRKTTATHPPILRPSIVVLWATFCVFTSPCVSCCRTVLWVFRGLLGPSCPMDLWMPMCHSIKKQLEQRHAVKQTCDCSCSDRISTHSCVICIASQLEPRHAAKQPCECSCSDRIMCSTHGLWHATVISRVKTCCQESLWMQLQWQDQYSQTFFRYINRENRDKSTYTYHIIYIIHISYSLTYSYLHSQPCVFRYLHRVFSRNFVVSHHRLGKCLLSTNPGIWFKKKLGWLVVCIYKT